MFRYILIIILIIPSLLIGKSTSTKWFTESKFGIFIHWGLYSNIGYSEWAMDHFRIPPEEYSKMTCSFNPQKFDPVKWAKLFKKSGAKYVVITAKHHDGFCLYDSKFTDYKITNTPYGKDAIMELKNACEAEGIKYGIYYSVIDWYHEDYLPRRYWDKRETENADTEKYKTFFKNQVTELIENYDPVTLWFDGGWESTFDEDETNEITEMIYQLKPEILINNRLSNNAIGDFKTPEGFVPATGIKDENGNPEVWETCTTMGDCWGYNPYQTEFQSSRDLIRMLIEVTSKGGNLLLNVGPTPDGAIQPEFEDRLLQIGEWIQKYGNSIYKTTENQFDVLPFYGTSTSKENTIYLQIYQKEKNNTIKLPIIHNIQAANFLNERSTINFNIEDGFMTLDLNEILPDKNSSVIEISLGGKLEYDEFLPVYTDNQFTLNASEAIFDPIDTSIKKEQYYDKIFLKKWDYRAKDKAVKWKFNLEEKAKYKIEIYATSRNEQSGEMESIITINGNEFNKTFAGLPQWTALNKALDEPNILFEIELQKGLNEIKIQLPKLINNQEFVLEKIEIEKLD